MSDAEERRGMPARARRGFEPIVFGVALVAFAGWTVGVLTGWLGDNLDSRFPAPALDPRSYGGQIAEAFSLATNPFFVMVLAALAAIAAFQQRQRRLSAALAIAMLGVPLWQLCRMLVDRPRPESGFSDSISAVGSAYPSGHLVAVTILLWMVSAIAVAQRRSRSSSARRRVLVGLLVLITAVDQWAMGTARPSDLVGGWLFGIVVASAALWIVGIESITTTLRAQQVPTDTGQRAAVIYNPTKILELDLFRRRVTFAMASAGWQPPLWLETTQDDPGREMTHDALAKDVDMVLVAGGDGTVRTVCSELAGSDVPLGVIPAGTGNLLSRNLGIPLDEDDALEVALHGRSRKIDLVRWSAGESEDSFSVMAGVGLDAQIMRDTDPRLKKLLKGGAYVVAGAQQIGSEPFHAKVTVDGKVVHDGEAVMTLVGNVGKLQGGFKLLPAANASDGLLHVMVASGKGLSGMMRLLAALGRETRESPVRRFDGASVEVELDREVAYEIDGDLEGEVAMFRAQVTPGQLLIKVPRRRKG